MSRRAERQGPCWQPIGVDLLDEVPGVRARPYQTVAGYIVEQVGRIPEVGLGQSHRSYSVGTSRPVVSTSLVSATRAEGLTPLRF